MKFPDGQVSRERAEAESCLNPGGVDGRLGSQTVSAIKSYQKSKGLLETGQTSQSLLFNMLRNGG